MKGKICTVGLCQARFQILEQSGDQLLLSQIDAIPGDISMIAKAWFSAKDCKIVDDSYRPVFY